MFSEKEKPLIPQDEIEELAAHAGVDMTSAFGRIFREF